MIEFFKRFFCKKKNRLITQILKNGNWKTISGLNDVKSGQILKIVKEAYNRGWLEPRSDMNEEELFDCSRIKSKIEKLLQ